MNLSTLGLLTLLLAPSFSKQNTTSNLRKQLITNETQVDNTSFFEKETYIDDVPQVPNSASNYNLTEVDSEQIEDLRQSFQITPLQEAQIEGLRQSLQITPSQKAQIELIYKNELIQIQDDLDTLRLLPKKESVKRVLDSQLLVLEGIHDVLTPRQRELLEYSRIDTLLEKFKTEGGELEGPIAGLICTALCFVWQVVAPSGPIISCMACIWVGWIPWLP